LVNKEPPATLCGSVKLCKNSTVEVTSSAECEICQFVVGEIENDLKSNKTVDEIVKRLESICNYTRDFKTECNDVVTNYVPDIINRLINGDDPQQVCDHVKLCTNVTRLVVSFLRSSDNETCSVCELVAKVAEVYVHEHKNMTQDELLDKLNKLCTDLPSDAGKMCASVVKLMGPTIIAEVIKGAPAEEICKGVRLCDAKIEAQLRVDNKTCEVCEWLVKYGESWLKSHPNANETEFVDEIEKICNLLPASEKKSCDGAVTLFGGIIFEELQHGAAPEKVCADIKLCTAAVVLPSLKLGDNETCKVCEVVMKYAESYMTAHPGLNETDLVTELENLCHFLPGNDSKKCDSFVSLMGPLIYTELKKGTPPEQLCHDIKLCDSADFQHSAPEVTPKSSNETCKMCEDIVKYSEVYLQKHPNTNETAFLADLEHICGLIPNKNESASCDRVVKLFGTIIYNELKRGTAPAQICHDVKLCESEASFHIPRPAHERTPAERHHKKRVVDITL